MKNLVKTNNATTIENLERRDAVIPPSERSFGFVFATVFAIIGIVKITSDATFRNSYLWLAIGALLVAISLINPRLLAPFNFIWFKFGLLLHKIVNPIVMGTLFYVVISPIGIVMNFLRKDILKLKIDKNLNSYWINRDQKELSTLKNQF